MRRVACIVALSTIGACLALSPPATADDGSAPSERALATALFVEGRRLFEDGHIAEACRKFEESERLDPGGGTLLNLAACHERESRTATAWTEFEEALAQARRDGRADRAEIAIGRMAALEPRLAHVTIVVTPSANRQDLSIALDGNVLRPPAWGVPLPIDSGEHTVEASAPLATKWRTTFEVQRDAEARSIEIPVLASQTEAAPVARGTSDATGTPSTQSLEAKPENESTGQVWRDVATTSALVAGASGALLGTYFGIRAIQLNNDAASACHGGYCSVGAAIESDHAVTCADLSTGAFILGAAGLGAAAALFFTRRHAPVISASTDTHGVFVLARTNF